MIPVRLPVKFSKLFRFKPRQSLVAVALVCASNVAWAEPPNHQIKDPYYGDTLFQFFQDRYFDSVTSLMVSQHFGRVSHHVEEAEVLRGGILLSYGLHREAGDIFTRLIEMGATPKTRDRAWFYLAKIRYQRAYLKEAEEALQHIGNALPVDLQEEKILLQSNLLLAREDYVGAVKVLSTLNLKLPSARYARYNLGIALIKSGEVKRGTTMLDELGRAGAESEEYRSLRDRANVSLGFAALADDKAKLARTYLERVRLKSPFANKALLGLGWASDQLDQTKVALIPWLELTERSGNDAAVLEAQIAVPYAYAKLGAYGQAVDGYQQAVTAFTKEDTALNESITVINSGTFLKALIERNPGEEMGWFWNLTDLPEMPHSSHLTDVLAQHAFQEAFKNYRDLIFLESNLQEWRDKLVVFQDMLDNRRKAFAERLPQITESAKEIGVTPLAKRHDVLSQELAQGEKAADGVAFADAKQLDLLVRVSNVDNTLKDLSDQPEFAEDKVAAQQRARLTAGLLKWQLAQDFPNRVWQVKKELQIVAEEIERAQKLEQALAQAQKDEPARFDAFAQRIAAINPVLDVMIPRVANLKQEQQQALQQIAINELKQQKERIAGYTTQARFALAQLYDQGKELTENSKENSKGDSTSKAKEGAREKK